IGVPGSTVNLEVVLTAHPVVPDPRRVRYGGVDLGAGWVFCHRNRPFRATLGSGPGGCDEGVVAGSWARPALGRLDPYRNPVMHFVHADAYNPSPKGPCRRRAGAGFGLSQMARRFGPAADQTRAADQTVECRTARRWRPDRVA